MIKKLLGICYLKLINSLLTICIFVLFSCNSKTEKQTKFDILFDFLKSNNKIPFNDKATSILVLSESGCPTCNKSYSRLLNKFINNKNALILVTASGTSIDISAFEADTISNVFFDDRSEFSKLNLVTNSGAIFLNKTEIDTIINITAENIHAQFEYIVNRLSNK